jgi:hypothetical protein
MTNPPSFGTVSRVFSHSSLLADLAKKHKLSKETIYGADSDDDGSEELASDSGDDLRASQNSGMSWRTGSNGSFLADDDEDDDMMDDSDDVVDDYANETRWMDNDALMLDLHNYKVVYGEDSVSVRGMPLLEQVEVELKCEPLEILSTQTASAWGVDVTTPIHLRISFSDSAYLDTQKPTTQMEIYQLVDGKKGVRNSSFSDLFPPRCLTVAWRRNSA